MNTQTSTLHHQQLISRKSALLTFLALATALLASDQPKALPVAPAPRAVQAPPQIPPPPTQPASFLAWETDAKNFDAQPGELTARFTIYVTNVSSEVVVIRELKRSCGCTDAKLPAQPWAMSAGTNGPIVATMDLRGRTGRLSRTLTVESSAGSKTLLLNVNLPPAPAPAPAAPVTASTARAELPKATSVQ